MFGMLGYNFNLVNDRGKKSTFACPMRIFRLDSKVTKFQISDLEVCKLLPRVDCCAEKPLHPTPAPWRESEFSADQLG